MGSVSLVTGGVGELVSQLDGGLVGWAVTLPDSQEVGWLVSRSVSGSVKFFVSWWPGQSIGCLVSEPLRWTFKLHVASQMYSDPLFSLLVS